MSVGFPPHFEAPERLGVAAAAAEEASPRHLPFTTWNLVALPKAVVAEYRRSQEEEAERQAHVGEQRGRTGSLYDPWRDIYLRGNFHDKKAKNTQQQLERVSKSTLEASEGREDPASYDDDYYDYQYYGPDYDYEKDAEPEVERSDPTRMDYHLDVDGDYSELDPHVPRRRISSYSESDWRREEEERIAHQKAQTWNQKKPYEYFDPSKQPQEANNKVSKPNSSSLVPLITRRIANSLFGPTSLTILTILGVPLLLGLAYFIFVVNGPTPVVRARHEEAHGAQSYEEWLVEAVYRALDFW